LPDGRSESGARGIGAPKFSKVGLAGAAAICADMLGHGEGSRNFGGVTWINWPGSRQGLPDILNLALGPIIQVQAFDQPCIDQGKPACQGMTAASGLTQRVDGLTNAALRLQHRCPGV
jgi:hypothetical protein